ncbi:MAG TPA: acyl-CoA carboxylase subunit beta, partial [Bacteroidetes bacterium]|nr:acyl-CoA carboxylase subunit beta [Bacteroidota bacterium]
EAIRMAREGICSLEPSNEKQGIRQPETEVADPLYDSDELMGIVSSDIKKPIEAREIIARFTDGSVFHEFKPEYGNTLVTGWANVHGYRVGIIANNGVLFSESANKGTHFIQLCNMQNTPIIYLQNITGFMVGKDYEEGGIIKDGAKMINAVSNSEVPTITIMIGASYGAGNYAMNGRAYQPRFLFSYPNAKIAVMGPEQLSGVMQSIQRQAAHKAGLPYDEEQAEQMRTYLMMEVEKKSNALYATGQLWDDGVIDPRQTRNYLGFCLNVVHNKAFNASNSYGIYRM